MSTVSISDEKIDGVLQSNPVVFSACESREFMEHGVSFVRSVTDNGMCCHVHIINPSPMVHEVVSELSDDVETMFTASFEKYDLNGKTNEQRDIKYISSKYEHLPKVLLEAGKVLVLNIDSLVVNEIVLPDSPLAVSGNSTNPTNDVLYITEEAGEVSNVLAYYAFKGDHPDDFIGRMSLELFDKIHFLGQKFVDLDGKYDDNSIVWKSGENNKYIFAKTAYGCMKPSEVANV